MGVVHKLKQEVIDFILQSKKNQSRISVRQLAEITGQKFQTKISKSSVSNVLKESALSSPVGRPSIKKKDKIFTIPHQAKQRIREEIRKVGLTPEVEEKSEASIEILKSEETESMVQELDSVDTSKPVGENSTKENTEINEEDLTKKHCEVQTDDQSKQSVVEDNTAEITPEILENSIDSKVTENEQNLSTTRNFESELGIPEEANDDLSDSPLSLRADPMAQILDGSSDIALSQEGDLETKKMVPQQDKIVEVGHSKEKPLAGSLIFSVVSQALTQKSILTPLLADLIAHNDLPDFELLCQAEVFYQWAHLGLGVAPEVIDMSPFWQYMNNSGILDRALFQERLDSVDPDKVFQLKYITEREQLDIDVSGFRVVLKNEGTFFIDAFNQSLTIHNVKGFQGRPLNLAVADLSSQLISFVRPLIVHHLGDQQSSLRALKYLCLACSDLGGQSLIKTVSLLNMQGDEIACFNVIAPNQRNFLIGLPVQDDYLKGAIVGEAIFSMQNQEYLLTIRNCDEVDLKFDEDNISPDLHKTLKIIELSGKSSDGKRVFMSNCENSGISQLIENYMERWGSLFIEEFNSFKVKKGEYADKLSYKGRALTEMRDYFLDYGEYVAYKIQKWLFPDDWTIEVQKAVIKAICLCSGYVVMKGEKVQIFLNKQKIEHELREKSALIIKRFNKYGFYDFYGRQINIKYLK